MGSDRDGDASKGPERRIATRVTPALHPSVPDIVYFHANGIEGNGLIKDISLTGAHVAEASEALQPGTRTDLYFLQPATLRRIHAVAEVVRRTRTGFAVRFRRMERELEGLVLAAAEERDAAGS